jgi:hypothetical protein
VRHAVRMLIGIAFPLFSHQLLVPGSQLLLFVKMVPPNDGSHNQHKANEHSKYQHRFIFKSRFKELSGN